MKIKASDYIVDFLNKNGINTLFTITGGFSMHLSDSFGNNGNYNILYQHHEQACGYSAVGYSKTNNKPCIVCTTAGCAATNAITPCLIAHQDSLPVLFISGQVKSNESIRKINNDKMKLRHYAGADCDIISIVSPITKYAKEILDISELKEMLREALYQLTNGRPGPVWLSIPIDIQSIIIDLDDNDYLIKKPINTSLIDNLLNAEEKIAIANIKQLLMQSKRPLIIAGNGIKLGGCVDKFNDFINKYKIPAVVTILSTDVIETDNELYAGKIGLIGDRHGNFTLQNCDLLISFGCRMAQGLVGYRADWFAREAKIVYIDNDQNELEKENVNYTLKVKMDLNKFFDSFDSFEFKKQDYTEWINKCNHWKNKWINELPPLTDAIINPYYALGAFFKNALNNKITICSSGSIVTNLWHMVKIKHGDKYLQSSQGDMGFELPAAIGAQIAEPNKSIIAILGEGSFQLNMQELQTIIQYKLPIKILLFNNDAYGANVITQTTFFNSKYGVNKNSGISFPDTEKVANAYGIKYICVKNNADVEQVMDVFINTHNEAIILEVFCCIQGRYPRLNAIKNEDGTFTNRPFEDMDPFLNRDEFEKEMIVKIV